MNDSRNMDYRSYVRHPLGYVRIEVLEKARQYVEELHDIGAFHLDEDRGAVADAIVMELVEFLGPQAFVDH